IIRRTANNVGDVEEGALRLADLSNPNLKPWVVDHLKKANEDSLAGKLRYASRASCRPAGVPMFLTYAGRFQPIYFLQTPREVVLINLGDTQVRHVYMNVPHLGNRDHRGTAIPSAVMKAMNWSSTQSGSTIRRSSMKPIACRTQHSCMSLSDS